MIKLISEKCIACKLCEKACLFGGIRIENKVPVLTDHCINCGVCVDVCKVGAIESVGTKKGPVHNIEMYKDVCILWFFQPGILFKATSKHSLCIDLCWSQWFVDFFDEIYHFFSILLISTDPGFTNLIASSTTGLYLIAIPERCAILLLKLLVLYCRDTTFLYSISNLRS